MMHSDDEMIRKLMDNLDLTVYEARIYLSLLRYNSLTVSRISEISKVPRSKCYDVLRSLQLKGLISRILSKPIKYEALPLKVAFSNRLIQMKKVIEEKEKGIEKLRREIEEKLEKQKTKEREFKVTFLEDPITIFTSMLSDTLTAKKEIKIVISRSPVIHHWEANLNEYIQVLNRGVFFKFLVYSPDHFLSRTMEIKRTKENEEFFKRGQIQLRSTNHIYQPFSIIDDRITYIYLTDPLLRQFRLAIRIEDKIFTEHMKSIFELLWNNAMKWT